MLGSRVKLTIVDPFQSDDESDTSSEDTSESIEPPRTIVVSGVTKKKFRNEKALKSYFESPQSGGGEVDKIEYSKGKAVITFRDPHGEALSRNKSNLIINYNFFPCSDFQRYVYRTFTTWLKYSAFSGG